jgi:lipoic acid synthetase
MNPDIPTKSGLMLGLGESEDEILDTLKDLRENHCRYLTLGQYLQPTPKHLAVENYVPPETFDLLKGRAEKMGFTRVAAGPFVRSSYHAGDLHTANPATE